MMRTPPALVSAASASLPSARMWENRPAASEMPPWTTRIVSAANATPGPSDAARPDAGPERRGERDRGEAVEQRLRRERLVVAAEAVLDRPDDGERPDAEEQ